MIRRVLTASIFVVILTGPASAQSKLTLKAEDAALPSDLGESIRSLLDPKALNVLDEKGNPHLTIWLRKTLDSKAAADKVAKGLTYRDLDESTLIGAVRLPKVWTDFRKQKVKAGVYTLRLGFQPMDGDHMGTAPFNEFCLLSPAAKDQRPDALETKALQEMSSGATGSSHPSVMLLYPSAKPAEAPTVESKASDTWLLHFQRPVNAGGQKAFLGFSLVVVGHTMAE